MTVRKLDMRLVDCLRELIATVKINRKRNMYYLLKDPGSDINIADQIRSDYYDLADPDKYVVAGTFDAIFCSLAESANKIKDPTLRDDLLYEASVLRDFLGFDRALRKPPRSEKRQISR